MQAFSQLAKITFRPSEGYAELAALEGDSAPTVARGVLRLLFVVGAFVALTATGRLVPAELVSGMISFSYVPFVQAFGLGVALFCFARPLTRATLSRAYALYLEGQGPWFLLFFGIVAACLFAPDPSRISRAAAPAFLLTLVWGGLTTVAFLRRGLGLSRARTFGVAVVFYVTYHAVLLGYFYVAGQLRPILPW